MHPRKPISVFAPAVLLVSIACIIFGVWVGRTVLETPREIDTAIGKRAPGKIRDAYGSTLKTFSLLGEHEYAYRLVCYDQKLGRVFARDIPIPEEVWRASTGFGARRRDVEQVTFSGNGSIAWSADGSEVVSLVHGQEIFRQTIP